MNRYMVEVALSDVDPQQFEALAAQEQVIVAEFVEAGFIEQIYVRNDLSGAYLIVRKDDESKVQELFSKFPMFPYMALKIIRLQS